MTVLMFGWEFPPHISGGLGTACHGLSRALINASDVVVGEEVASTSTFETGMTGGTRLLSVPASLQPYSTREPLMALEQWNWEFSAETVGEIKTVGGMRYNFSGKYGPS